MIGELDTPITLLQRVEAPDGMGGAAVSWSEGAVLRGACVMRSWRSSTSFPHQGPRIAYRVTLRREEVPSRIDGLRFFGTDFRILSMGDEIGGKRAGGKKAMPDYVEIEVEAQL